ncbi:MAG: 4a-hydroxytetrahydrobiopterin dehydratase [Edaphobacter sp.]|uniref:4a-hydroxytetrahydrobiopterin dehydratase n=1 Tax=Edaphobacter sp. TaxID=1934404 RepID=UPI0023A235FF|nr:4a-hydroxytetrahydrobiopterin dehydratase [Edaphobacter sp.]MDE1175054.1 4a-hydroxytetrahydrobiopterin dehydratase [Edaphobacter sp.]
MSVLTQQELSSFLQSGTKWHLQDGQLIREWTFLNFKQAVAFVNRIADEAESANHHPDIDIRYNKVRLALVSHDAGGITARDSRMASRIDGLPE